MPTFEELNAMPSLSTTTAPPTQSNKYVQVRRVQDPAWNTPEFENYLRSGLQSSTDSAPNPTTSWDASQNTLPSSTTPIGYTTPTATNNSSSYTSQSYVPSVTNPPPTPVNPQAPSYLSSLGDMYKKTFTDPNSMWDEYSQGQGVAFNQGAARAMAKAGRTGMLPTLNTLAHQDYMSNYLPSVRKDLAPGLGYENTWNQNLTQKYGQDQDFAQKTFGTEASMYGNALTYSSQMAQVAAQVQDIGVKQELGMLDNMMKQYGIDNDTQQQIYVAMSQMFPKMTDADQAAMVAELKLALSLNKTGNQTLADLTNPIGQGTTPLATTATTPTPATAPNAYADFGWQG